MYMYINYHTLSIFLLMYLFISIFILKFHFFLANILCKEFLLLRFISHRIKELLLDGDGKLGLALWQYVTGPSDEGYEGGLKAKPWKYDISTSLYSLSVHMSVCLCVYVFHFVRLGSFATAAVCCVWLACGSPGCGDGWVRVPPGKPGHNLT